MENVKITNLRVVEYKQGSYTLRRTECRIEKNGFSLNIWKLGEWKEKEMLRYCTQFFKEMTREVKA